MARSGVKGVAKVARRLQIMGSAVTPAAVHKAHEAALLPMRAEAALNLALNGSDKGRGMSDLIKVEHETKNRSLLGLTGHMRKIGHFIELGTAPHMFGGKVHPGASPKPFLRPAFDSGSRAALNAAGTAILASISQVGRRNGGKGEA
ncbi:MAG: hypothetical protein ACRCWF_17710 [Beijerinckiaceae bacterium]